MSGALDLFRLDGKVAVVTGGSKGIGMFYSQALAEAGASVVVADIDLASVAQTSERLSKEHDGRILGADLDVTSQDSIRAGAPDRPALGPPGHPREQCRAVHCPAPTRVALGDPR